MASIINAATSGGLVTTADTSGILQLQTAGTTAVTVDASQNVGIGGAVTNEGGYARCLQVTGSTDCTLELKAGSDFSVLAQNGSTLQIRNNATAGAMTFSTVSTERARFNATGALVFAGGTTTANGIGITFPATQSASSDANTLDDYEEGTWSPSIGGSTTYTVQDGYYTKCGNVVTVTGRMQINLLSGNANTYQITNLPFTSKNTSNGSKAGGGFCRILVFYSHKCYFFANLC